MTVNDSEQNMRTFMEDGGWVFPVMLDADSAANDYKVPAIPTTFVIDAEGRVVKKIIGGVTAERLTGLIEALAS